MKNLLKTLLLIPFIGITMAWAQPCVPGPETAPGIYPDSATGLPVGYADVFYEAVMTVVVPVDTTISGFTVPIDSIGIVNFQGLPPGFSYTADRASGYWPGGTKGCVLISGMHSVVGEYPLVIEVEGYAGVFHVPWTIDFYKIVLDSTHLSIEKMATDDFEVFQNTPNPFSGVTEISFTSKQNDVYTFEVFNMIGKIIHSEEINADKGLNRIYFDANDLTHGVYFYQLRNATRSQTKRMIISN